MKSLKKKVAEAVYKGLLNIAPGAAVTADEIITYLAYPPDDKMGDIALPCFKFAKELKMAPPAIAAKLAENFSCEGIRSAEVAGGYLNLKIDRGALCDHIYKNTVKADKPYGTSDEGSGKTVVLDYSSPNVAKPFHIGHLGTTVIGHALKKMHEFAGYKCIGINHLGDYGTQFGKLTVAYKKWGDKEAVEQKGIDELVALYVRFHEEAEKEPGLNDEARAAFAALEHGDPEITQLWRWFIDISIAEYKKTYKQLDIEFDYYTGESFYTDKMPAVVEELKEKNLLTLDDGASIVNLEEYGMPPCLILKRDGSTLYPTRDIAAAIYRKNTFDFDKCIYVTSAGQCLHFAQWFKVLELMGRDWYKDLVHIPYGTVSLNGSKLATRTGNVVLLKDLFAEAIEKAAAVMAEKNPELAGREDIAESVGIGAVVFYYLSANRMRDINFVLEDALNFDGNTGPYAQYTYARTCQILHKAGAYEVSGFEPNDDEFALCKTLSLFPETFDSALAEYEPSVITRYILQLCADYNRFYHNCPVLTAETEQLKAQRLALTEATNKVLAQALELICVRHPEKI
ncbi:MAG: arginine--tRNA ligase [Clostridia bacterium]|nr:arginine--tRNA ligase [Clostridia bacterium]